MAFLTFSFSNFCLELPRGSVLGAEEESWKLLCPDGLKPLNWSTVQASLPTPCLKLLPILQTKTPRLTEPTVTPKFTARLVAVPVSPGWEVGLSLYRAVNLPAGTTELVSAGGGKGH